MINSELILLDSNLEQRDSILEALSNKASRLGYVSDSKTYIKSVLQRESEFSTAIGYDVAMPHGKTSAVKTPFVAFLRTTKPILWDESTKNPVRLVFLIGVPEEQRETLHLKILAQVSRKLLDEQFRNELLNGDELFVFNMLKDIEKNIQ